MTRGAILFAFNNPKHDYYVMAEYAAKRINHFLNLPVTLVTDEISIKSSTGYSFDKVAIVEPDKNNTLKKEMWINKGRYQAYELSPYDETLLLDVDYMVNSNKLLTCFDFYDDFCCHDNTDYLLNSTPEQEMLSAYSIKTLWATVVAFKKSNRTQQIFECLEMVQKNYHHYADIHNFLSSTFRNDYALTLALRIVNGHVMFPRDIIPWNLMHAAGKNLQIYANSDEQFNTEFTFLCDHTKKGKIKKEYLIIKDMDFHVMNKNIFAELIKHG